MVGAPRRAQALFDTSAGVSDLLSTGCCWHFRVFPSYQWHRRSTSCHAHPPSRSPRPQTAVAVVASVQASLIRMIPELLATWQCVLPTERAGDALRWMRSGRQLACRSAYSRAVRRAHIQGRPGGKRGDVEGEGGRGSPSDWCSAGLYRGGRRGAARWQSGARARGWRTVGITCQCVAWRGRSRGGWRARAPRCEDTCRR